VSHVTIIISSGPSGGNLVASTEDRVQVTYTPDDALTPQEVGKEVAKRIKWIEKKEHHEE
jgi:hypothetical protein